MNDEYNADTILPAAPPPFTRIHLSMQRPVSLRDDRRLQGNRQISTQTEPRFQFIEIFQYIWTNRKLLFFHLRLQIILSLINK